MSGDVLRELGLANLPTPAPAVDLITDLLNEHRRGHNCRVCTACAWAPARSGGTHDPASVRRRNQDFNRHLADLIVSLLL